MKKYLFLLVFLVLPIAALVISCGSGSNPASLVKTYSATGTPTITGTATGTSTATATSTPTPSVSTLATFTGGGNDGMTVDSFGNIFVALTSAGNIAEITSAGVTSTLLTVTDPNAVGFYGTNWFFTATNSPEMGVYSGGVSTVTTPFNYGSVGVAINSSGTTVVVAGSSSGNTGVTPYYQNTGGSWVLSGGTFTITGISTTGSQAVAYDKNNNLYLACTTPSYILKFAVGTTSNPVTVSGVAGPGFANGTFTTAKFSSPGGIAVDSFGNIFVADTGNAAIREISGGQVTTLVGTSAQNAVITTLSPALVSPQGIAVDASGSIYFSDSSTNSVYKYVP